MANEQNLVPNLNNRNRGGRPKGFRGVARQIMRETHDGRELVEFALKTFRDEKETWFKRWDAFVWLSDRGLGRPMQTIELAAALEVGEQKPLKLDLQQMTDGELMMLTEAFKRAKGEPTGHDYSAMPHSLNRTTRCPLCPLELEAPLKDEAPIEDADVVEEEAPVLQLVPELIPVSQVARELGIDPKKARAQLRRLKVQRWGRVERNSDVHKAIVDALKEPGT